MRWRHSLYLPASKCRKQAIAALPLTPMHTRLFPAPL